MSRRLLSYGIVVLFTLVLSEAFHPFAALQTMAQPGCRTFTETGKTVCGRFLQYWSDHGGLAQQGFPLTGEFTEVSDLNGKPYTVQYFERAVFEKHPENAAPNDVLLSQLGTFQFQRKYPGGDPSGGVISPTQPPAQGGAIVGQTLDIDDIISHGKIRIRVTDVSEATVLPKSTGGPEMHPKGKYVVVFMHAENISNVPSALSTAYFRLKDSKGRQFDAADFAVQFSAHYVYSKASAGTTVQPGLTDEFVFVFDVAVDAGGYVLVKP